MPANNDYGASSWFDRHSLLALLAGRFMAFVRTLLPTMAGISGLSNRRFPFFNWLSGLLWVTVVTSFGYALSMICRVYPSAAADELVGVNLGC